MNHKKLRPLYREERLQVRRRSGRKQAAGTRLRWHSLTAQTSAGAWIFYRTHSSMAGGFASWRSSTIFTRECLTLVADTPLPACV
jgi:putative transposase